MPIAVVTLPLCTLEADWFPYGSSGTCSLLELDGPWISDTVSLRSAVCAASKKWTLSSAVKPELRWESCRLNSRCNPLGCYLLIGSTRWPASMALEMPGPCVAGLGPGLGPGAGKYCDDTADPLSETNPLLRCEMAPLRDDEPNRTPIPRPVLRSPASASDGDYEVRLLSSRATWGSPRWSSGGRRVLLLGICDRWGTTSIRPEID